MKHEHRAEGDPAPEIARPPRRPGYISMPNGWMDGLLDTLLELESENNRLRSALIRAEEVLGALEGEHLK